MVVLIFFEFVRVLVWLLISPWRLRVWTLLLASPRYGVPSFPRDNHEFLFYFVLFLESCNLFLCCIMTSSSVGCTSSNSWSSWNNSFCSCSLVFIHSCTIESRFFCQTPRCYFHTLLFLVTLLIYVITCFLVPFSLLSLSLLFLFQLFNQGLCQLHSISACLGNIHCFHSSSLTFLICLM